MTTETQSSPSTPKKSSILKKIFIVVAIGIIILAIEHLTFIFSGIGSEKTTTDSTNVVSTSIDTTKSVSTSSVVVTDTIKKDTIKQK